MQVVALVTGDEFLVPYNLTIDTEDVLVYINLLSKAYETYQNFVTFDDYYGIDFARVIGSTGFCYNFNMVNASQLLRLDQ
jgi:hypothetical protein